MNRAMEQLTQAQHKAAEALYKQRGRRRQVQRVQRGSEGRRVAGSATVQRVSAGCSGPQGDVIDAEVWTRKK